MQETSINWCYKSQHKELNVQCFFLSKNVSNLCPKGNAGRESRPHWIHKYTRETMRNTHTERKNKRWISKLLTICWDKARTARSQAELNTENHFKTNSKKFSSYPNKSRTRKEEMGSLVATLCQYAAEVKGNLGRAPTLKEHFTSAFRNKM